MVSSVTYTVAVWIKGHEGVVSPCGLRWTCAPVLSCQTFLLWSRRQQEGRLQASPGCLRGADAHLLCCSCISWSSYHKNLLASSDYEGTVILWDGFTGQKSKVYQVAVERLLFPVAAPSTERLYYICSALRFPFCLKEHEKRCWSVDFNLMDPKLLASGSDDAKGKRGPLHHDVPASGRPPRLPSAFLPSKVMVHQPGQLGSQHRGQS